MSRDMRAQYDDGTRRSGEQRLPPHPPSTFEMFRPEAEWINMPLHFFAPYSLWGVWSVPAGSAGDQGLIGGCATLKGRGEFEGPRLVRNMPLRMVPHQQ